ncbi:hypothetical protein LEMLEM_LOCUS26102 [Lemmus lemmus]
MWVLVWSQEYICMRLIHRGGGNEEHICMEMIHRGGGNEEHICMEANPQRRGK